MPRYLVVITETIVHTREFTAKDEESAIEKAQAMFEKDESKFDSEQSELEYTTEEP